MGKNTWKNPKKKPKAMDGDVALDMKNECPKADQSKMWVVVDQDLPISANDFGYNCLGWACFQGPRPQKSEPDFEPTDNQNLVAAILKLNGYTACQPDQATCVVLGGGPYDIGHVIVRWQGLSSVDQTWRSQHGNTDWWESRMGVVGAHVLHERDALLDNSGYGKELAWFN